MPSGALPARFRRTRVLIIGCGDVGLRAARALPASVRVMALTRDAARAPAWRAAGIVPLTGDLDHPASLARLAGLGQRVLHLAPPPADGEHDPRTRALLRALARRTPPRALVYGSTTGVYGNCDGQQVQEWRTPAPATARARRRMAAEQWVRHMGRRHGTRAAVLRIPGIYAPDRANNPRQRLLRGVPVLQEREDVYVNHIHADDLARACVLALWRAAPQRIYHVCDDSRLRMGEYFDLAAQLYALPRLPRISRAQAQATLPPTLLSFMSESRLIANTRARRELRLRLRYPTPAQGLLSA